MVDGRFHHEALLEQSSAFRAAAVRSGPDAVVSSCPGWDVGKLVRHLARVYEMMSLALDLPPEGPGPQPSRPPDDFDAALSLWDENLGRLVHKFSTLDPEQAVWSFFPGGKVHNWVRRAAHETAIHRLDAELASAGVAPDHVHDLLFAPPFAADGVDEMLSVLTRAADWTRPHPTGRVLYHAADAGQAWLVIHRPGQPPEVGAPHDAALGRPETDATVAGTADAVYRRVWGRPSTAVVTGDQALADLIAGR